jgi:hypothetical protein
VTQNPPANPRSSPTPAGDLARLREAVRRAKSRYEDAYENGDADATRKLAVLRILLLRYQQQFPDAPENRRQRGVWEWAEND